MDPVTNGEHPPVSAVDPIGQYKRLLQSGQAASLEAAGGEPDLSDPAINHRLETARTEMHRVISGQLDDRSDLHDYADRVVDRGDLALQVIRDGDEQRLREMPELADSLEVVVAFDGTRPSFLIQNGEVDQTSIQVGQWGAALDGGGAELKQAISCVGRIDVPHDPDLTQGFAGTGFLVHPDLIVTNRHVLQMIATPQDDGAWQLKDDVVIDFGHEFRGQASINPRRLKQVVFCGTQTIPLDDATIDHSKLDLALIELEPGPAPDAVLAVDVSPDWPAPDLGVFLIGYPGNPGYAHPDLNEIERIYRETFGYKRLAPGNVMTSGSAVKPWTVTHDATTIKGNSGSIVLIIGREKSAAALHYGGTRANPRANWGHILGLVLDTPGTGATPTLREALSERGVDLFDPFE